MLTLFLFQLLVTIFLLNSYAIASAPETAWHREYHTSYSESGTNLIATSDGGYLLAGNSNIRNEISGQLEVFPYLRKVNASGEVEWYHSSRTFGQGNTENVFQMSNNGGYLITGTRVTSTQEALIQHVDVNGNIASTLALDGYNAFYRVIERSDIAGYAAVGQKKFSSEFGFGGALALLNENLEIDSIHFYLNQLPGTVEFQDIQPTSYGYLLVGHSGEFLGSEKYGYLVGVDHQGNELFNRTYGRQDSFMTLYNSCLAHDGGFIIVGCINGLGSAFRKALVMHVSEFGDSIWATEFEFGDTNPDITTTIGGGYVIAASSFDFDHIAHLVKINASGDSLWTVSVVPEFNSNTWQSGFGVCSASDGGYLLVGGTTYWGDVGVNNSFLLRVLPDSLDKRASLATMPTEIHLLQNYPNPFNSTTTIPFYLSRESDVSLNLYDVLGRHTATLLSGNTLPGIHQINFATSDLATGVYFYELRQSTSHEVRKLVLVK